MNSLLQTFLEILINHGYYEFPHIQLNLIAMILNISLLLLDLLKNFQYAKFLDFYLFLHF